MKISVLGCGRWGSFIGWYLNKIKHDVVLWGLEDSEITQELIKNRKNNLLSFDKSITISSDLDYAVSHAEVIVISISSQGLRGFMKTLSKYNLEGKTIVLCMKGIEETTGKRLTQIVEEVVSDKTNIAIWVGPGHVQDFSRGIPNCMVIDSKSRITQKMLIDNFSSELIRFYYGTDLIGNEVGAAAKNVMGIAAGMLDGIGYTSLKGALMSRGTREIARLIEKIGGNPISAYGLAHLGDYQATLFSEHSHNRMFGELFIKGEKYTALAEGVSTTRALIKLGNKYGVELPICSAIDSIVNKNQDPKKVLSNLFIRSIKNEF